MGHLKMIMYLNVHSEKKAKFLSGGNKRKLCCAMALISKPDLIFMDEFQNGVDPISRKNLYSYLKSLKDTATLIITHHIDEAEKICDRIAIMHRGKFLELDTPTNLKEKHGTVFILQIEPAKNSTISLDKLDECVLKNLDFCRRIYAQGQGIDIQSSDYNNGKANKGGTLTYRFDEDTQNKDASVKSN